METRMKRISIVLCAFVGLVLVTQDVLADPTGSPLETLTIPSTGESVATLIILLPGQEYYLLAEGTWAVGGDGWPADAEWIKGWIDENWIEHHTDYPELPGLHDILVDGAWYDWMASPLLAPDPLTDFDTFAVHTFSPSHKYWLCVIGNGVSLNLMVSDNVYGDNSGSLTVHVYASSMPPPPDPAELLVELTWIVVDMNHQNGIPNSLDAKLDAALNALCDTAENNDVAAVNALGAFMNAVEAQRGNKLTNEQANILIAAAQEIIALLTAG